MTDDEDAPAESEVRAIADRLRYAPEQVDYERALAVFAMSGPDGRATIADAIGSMPAGSTAELTDAVPILVEMLESDVEENRRYFVEALARIAEAEPGAVRPAVDGLLEELTTFNIWVNRAAAEALRHVIVEYPAEIERIEPLLGHDKRRIQARAASVLAAASEREPSLAAAYLDDCVELVRRNALARADAVDVLADAGWIDPAALDPAVDVLVSIVRGNESGSDRRRRGTDVDAADARGDVPDSESETEAEDEAAMRLAALRALTHVAGHDPESVQSLRSLCVDLAVGDREEFGRAAATLLVAVVLQDQSTGAGLRDVVETRSYFERRELVEALAAASVGLPGREQLFTTFLDDDSRFIRFEAYRQYSPVEA